MPKNALTHPQVENAHLSFGEKEDFVLKKTVVLAATQTNRAHLKFVKSKRDSLSLQLKLQL